MTDPSGQKAAILLMVAAGAWYAASRAASTAASAGQIGSSGRRAAGMALPGAVLVLLAIYQGRPEAAIGILFASSIACLTLVLGIVTLSASHTRPTQNRRIWGFLLPVALIAMLIGLHGRIGIVQAIILAVEGIVLLLLWNDSPQIARAAPVQVVSPVPPPAWGEWRPSGSSRLLLLVLAILLSCAGAWSAMASAGQISGELNLAGYGVVVSLMLAPAIVLPMIGSGSAAAHAGRYDQALTAQLGFVLINICGILPLASVLWITRPYWHPPETQAVSELMQQINRAAEATSARTTSAPAHAALPASAMSATTRSATTTTTTATPATEPTTAPQEDTGKDFVDLVPRAMPYPMAVWRVDTVLLVAIGLLLLPVSIGRWNIGIFEGYGLLATYTIYLALTAFMAR